MTTIAQRFARAEVNLSGILRSGIEGLLAGMAAGMMARLSMRVIALAGGQRPDFSIAGTLFILVVFGVVFGVPLGWLGGALSSGDEQRAWLKPLLISLGIFLFLSLLAALIGGDSEELAIVPGIVAIAAFLPVPVTYAIAYTLIRERMRGVEFLAERRGVNLPSFLILAAVLSWAFYALSRLVEAGRTLPLPIFESLLRMGLRPSAIHNIVELAVFLMGSALIALPAFMYWREYRSPRGRMTTVATLGGLGAAFWLLSSLV